MITIRVTGVNELVRKLDPDKIDKPLIKFMKLSSVAVQDRTKALAPVDTGDLAASMTYKVKSAELAEIWPDIHYGIYQDQGTVHTRMPPPAALEGWARRHGFPNGYVVARAILRRGGLRKQEFMKGGAHAAMGKIKGYARTLARELVDL